MLNKFAVSCSQEISKCLSFWIVCIVNGDQGRWSNHHNVAKYLKSINVVDLAGPSTKLQLRSFLPVSWSWNS